MRKVIASSVDGYFAEHPFSEHPEDRRMRLAATRKAKKTIALFVKRHQRELVKLVLTYADDDAIRRLDALREKFWSSRFYV